MIHGQSHNIKLNHQQLHIFFCLQWLHHKEQHLLQLAKQCFCRSNEFLIIHYFHMMYVYVYMYVYVDVCAGDGGRQMGERSYQLGYGPLRLQVSVCV